MKKVLILTASFGEGHNAAARSIREAMGIVDPDAEVEVVDLFQSVYGRLNRLARAAYLTLIRHAPTVWQSLYRLLDASPELTGGVWWRRMRTVLTEVLASFQPDGVVSTYPVYAGVIGEIYRDHAERPFRLVTVVTDSISINATWVQAPSDWYCVSNEATAEVLAARGVDRARIVDTGFPVAPAFQSVRTPELADPGDRGVRRVLCLLHSGGRKERRMVDEILDLPHTELTIITGRDAKLRARLHQRYLDRGDRVRILGWTNLMADLMASHHLIVTKAGGAIVQEAIASRCPLVIHQVIPGQEEGNAELVRRNGYGCVVESKRAATRAIAAAFTSGAQGWREWRSNLIRDARPGAALRIANLAFGEEDSGPTPSHHPVAVSRRSSPAATPLSVRLAPSGTSSLLCDFHIHTAYSDGRLTVAEVVDYYGAHGFDCICITDHVADPRRLFGKLVKLSGLSVSPAQFDEYFAVIRREAARAWRQYGMLVLAGFEFNKDGYTARSSAHLLGVGLSHPIAPDLDLPETIARIHEQEGLAIASHPHLMKSEWGKNTLYLWEHQETYAPLLDAWEIANRENLFAPVAHKRLPFVANSDFHKPRHIYSWKTVLHCEKDVDAIKDCVRRNERVSMTLYRPQRAWSTDETVVRPRFRSEAIEPPAIAAVP